MPSVSQVNRGCGRDRGSNSSTENKKGQSPANDHHKEGHKIVRVFGKISA